MQWKTWKTSHAWTRLQILDHMMSQRGGELLRRRALLRCKLAHTNGPIPFLRRGSAARQRFRAGAGQQFIPVPYTRVVQYFVEIFRRRLRFFVIFWCNRCADLIWSPHTIIIWLSYDKIWSGLVNYNPSYSHLKLKSPGKLRLSNIRELSNNRRSGVLTLRFTSTRLCFENSLLGLKMMEEKVHSTHIFAYYHLLGFYHERRDQK